MVARCVSCQRPVSRYASRCKSCARALWAAEHRDVLLVQLAAARASRPTKPKPPKKRRIRCPERIAFDAHAIRRATYAAGLTLSDLGQQSRVPAISSELRKRTLPYQTLDRIAVALGRHVSEFEIQETSASSHATSSPRQRGGWGE